MKVTMRGFEVQNERFNHCRGTNTPRKVNKRLKQAQKPFRMEDES